MQGRSSKQKGANGEREFAKLLTSFGFVAARQGRQFFGPGGREHEDVSHDVGGVHFEVKRREKFEPTKWLGQAIREAGARIPVVAWRPNRHPWYVIMHATDFLTLMAKIRDLEEALSEDSGNRE